MFRGLERRIKIDSRDCRSNRGESGLTKFRVYSRKWRDQKFFSWRGRGLRTRGGNEHYVMRVDLGQREKQAEVINGDLGTGPKTNRFSRRKSRQRNVGALPGGET